MERLTTYIGNLMDYSGSYLPVDTYPGSVSRRCPNITEKQSMTLAILPSLIGESGKINHRLV